MRRLILCIAVLLASAGGAGAQPAEPPDPIGALLDPKAPGPAPTPAPSNAIDEPDTAGQPIAPPPEPSLSPTASLPAAPIPYASPAYTPPRPKLTAPVHIEEKGKTPDAPPSVNALAYDSRIRSSFASAQGFQGPLDGGWTLATPSGERLYSLQLVDRRDRLEGAWGDLRRTAALGSSGLVDDIQRVGGELTLRITSGRGKPVVVTLRAAPDGRWTGELDEGGAPKPVVLQRSGL